MKKNTDYKQKIDLSKTGKMTIPLEDLETEIFRIIISYIEYRKWRRSDQSNEFPIEYRYHLFPIQEHTYSLNRKLLFRTLIKGFYQILVDLYHDKQNGLKKYTYEKIKRIFNVMAEEFNVDVRKAERFLDRMINTISVRKKGHIGGARSAAAETIGRVLLNNAGKKSVETLMRQASLYTPLHFDPKKYRSDSEDFKTFSYFVAELGNPKEKSKEE